MVALEAGQLIGAPLLHRSQLPGLARSKDEQIIGQERIRSAGSFDDPDALARGDVAHGWIVAPRRHVQAAAGRQQIALGREVILHLPPDFRSGAGIQCHQVHSVGRKHPRRYIHLAVLDHHRGAHRPGRNDATIARNSSIRRNRAGLPNQSSVIRLEAVDAAIVAAEIEATLVKSRSQSDRSLTEKAPEHFSRSGVQAADLIIGRRTEVRPTSGGHDMEGTVEGLTGLQVEDFVPPIPLGFSLPRGLRRMLGLPSPRDHGCAGQALGGDTTAGIVSAVGGPVGGPGRSHGPDGCRCDQSAESVHDAESLNEGNADGIAQCPASNRRRWVA